LIKFLKNNGLLILCLISISILAFWLRIIGIEKQGGLWNDEIVTYELVIKPINEVFMHSLPRPLYHVLLHCWISLFGDADTTLRFLSVIFGVCAVIAMYFAGRETENFYKKQTPVNLSLTGITASLLTAVNSFLIFYSQEVRQYSLLALIATLSALFTVRLITKPQKKEFLLFFAVNCLFLMTHFISIIIVISEIILISIYFFLYKKESLEKFLSAFKKFSPFLLIILILLLLTFFDLTIYSKHTALNTYDVYNFDLQVIFVILQNYFSPVLTGIYNNPPEYLSKLLENITLGKIVYIFAPTLLCLGFIIKAGAKEAKKLDPIKILILVPVIFLTIVFITSVLQTYIIISRYTLLCLPFLILAISAGVSSFQKKSVSAAFIAVILGINLLYIFASPNSAPKADRPEGIKKLADLFNGINLKENDYIIFPVFNNTINKYNKNKFQKYSIESAFLTKEKLHYFLDKKSLQSLSYNNSKEVIKDYLISKTIPANLEKYVLNEFIGKLKKDDYFIIAHSQSLAFYNQKMIDKIIKDPVLYKNTSLKFLLFSKISLDLAQISEKHLEFYQIRENSPWTILI